MDKYANIPVLIVEDDLVAQMALKQMLREIGFEAIDTAVDTEKARKKFNARNYGLVMLDVFLKGVESGIEFCREITSEKDIAVVFMTASVDPKTFTEIAKTQHVAVLEKPYDFQEIQSTVEKVLDQNNSIREIEDQSSEILKLIFDTANVGICVTNSQGRFVAVNKAYADLYGYKRNELIDQEFTIVLPEVQRDFAAKLHEDYIKGRTEESAGEWQVKRKDDTLIDIWVTVGRMRSSDGQPYKVTTVTDISERKAYIQKLEEELEKNNKLLQELHHRVKNNLNLISSLIYIKQNLYGGVSGNGELDAIRRRVQLVAKLNQLLLKNIEREFISAREIWEIVQSEIQQEYRDFNHKSLSVDFQDIEVHVENLLTLTLVLFELMDNAIRHGQQQNGVQKQTAISLDANNDKFLVIATNDGLIEESTTKGMGFTLIENLAESKSVSNSESTNSVTVEVIISRN